LTIHLPCPFDSKLVKVSPMFLKFFIQVYFKKKSLDCSGEKTTETHIYHGFSWGKAMVSG
jgi:hypothetical protein